MEFGISFANAATFASADGARTLGQAAEAAGFDSLWTVEHPVVPADYRSSYPYGRTGRAPGLEDSDLPDPLVWLTWVAAATEHLRLATGILVLPLRNPMILAKQVASLDALSAGRVLLGIGVGWLREEFDLVGVPFARRGARTDDLVAALRALWAGDPASHDGEFVSFRDAISRPHPVGGSVPIVVGGHSDAAARRAGRLGDGYVPAVDAATIADGGRDAALARLAELVAIARGAADEAGRAPEALEVSVSWGRPPERDVVERLADLGAHRVIVAPPTLELAGLPEALMATMDRLRA